MRWLKSRKKCNEESLILAEILKFFWDVSSMVSDKDLQLFVEAELKNRIRTRVPCPGVLSMLILPL